MSQNPYASPATLAVADAKAAAVDPALWNPGAAARWSLIFTPTFGAILHAKNWAALGEMEKARGQRIWAIANLVYVLVVIAGSAMLPDSKGLDAIVRFSGLGILLAWYFTGGKVQVAYVKEHFGDNYPRRGWGAPLLIAVACFAALVGVMIAVLVAIYMVTGKLD